MIQQTEFNMEEIVGNLENSWSQPEADGFLSFLKNKQYEQCREILQKEGFNDRKIDFILKYYKEQYTAKKRLVEYYACEFENFKDMEEILVSYGGSVFETTVCALEQYTKHKGNCFYNNNKGGNRSAPNYIPLSEAVQVWKMTAM